MSNNGAFTFGFNLGFLIYGDKIMATVDTLTRNQLNALTRNVTASGSVYSISGILQDDKFALVVQPSGASATANFTIYSGDYQNAGVGNYVGSVVAGTTYATEVLDGARFRKEDGTIDVAYDTPTGVFFAYVY